MDRLGLGVMFWSVLSLVAGCGGGESVNQAATFESMFERTETAYDLVSGLGPSGDVVLTSGTATYNGYFYANYDPRKTDLYTDLVGTTQLTADFAQNRFVSGSISNLIDVDNNRYVGTIPLVYGGISESPIGFGGPIVTASFDGQVTGANGGTYRLTADYFGEFRGGNENISGSTDGYFVTLDSLSGTVPVINTSYVGGFVASQ